MSETGPDPVASAMAGAVLGVEEDLAEATEVYGNMYAQAYWRAFDALKGHVGTDVSAGLGEDFQVLFYAFCKRRIEQRVGIVEVEVENLPDNSNAESSDPGRLGAGVCG